MNNQLKKKTNAGANAGILCSKTLLQTMEIMSLLRRFLVNTYQKH